MGEMHGQETQDSVVGILGLSRTALEAAILAQFQETEEAINAETIAAAVAAAFDANNREIMDQFRQILSTKLSRGRALVG